MKGWGKVFLAIGAVVLGASAVKHFVFPTYSHRYRLTVEAEIDNQVRIGTGVVTVKARDNGPLSGVDFTRFNVAASGQAPTINLGTKGLLVAVLDPNNFPRSYKPRPLPAKELSFLAYFGPQKPATDAEIERQFKEISAQRGVRTLDPNDYPGFVWIRDPQNGESADAVMPSDLDKIIDSTLRIKAITLEITNDRNTGQIFEVLPWLRNLREEEKAHGTLMRVGSYSLNARQLLGDD